MLTSAQSQNMNGSVHSNICPDDFYALPLISNAKQCQQFSGTLPASLSYFSLSDPHTVKNFYLEKFGPAESENTLKGRIILQYSQTQKTVIISVDGQGSQIDILVKSVG